MLHDELQHKKQSQTFAHYVGEVLIVLALGASTQAIAEQYCKTVDKSGAASYTLATAKGCNKKAKSVAISHAQPVVASKPVMNTDTPTTDTQSAPVASAPAVTTASAPAGPSNMLTVPVLSAAPPVAR